jgi:enolase
VLNIKRRKVLLSTGEFTDEVSVNNYFESSPSGCTKGLKEKPLYSKNDKNFNKLNINENISQQEFDGVVKKFGSSLSTASSLAFLKFKAQDRLICQYIGLPDKMPKVILNLINSGKHTGSQCQMCEFMIIPDGNSVSENINISVKVFKQVGKIIAKNGQNSLVSGREGGYVVSNYSNEEIISILDSAIKQSKVKCSIAIDVSANNFSYKTKNTFIYKVGDKKLTSKQMINYYLTLLKKYPLITYLEDPFHEQDIKGWKMLMDWLGNKIMIVADDLTVTNIKYIYKYNGCFNTLIVKVNQIGTITEFINAVKLARQNNIKIVVSQRSGETDSSIISDLAVGLNAEYLKSGSPARERIIKYNHLLRLEEVFKCQTI